MTLDKKLLDILACPDCHGQINLKTTKAKETLVCGQCQRVFEVKNGIPVMLPKEESE